MTMRTFTALAIAFLIHLLFLYVFIYELDFGMAGVGLASLITYTAALIFLVAF